MEWKRQIPLPRSFGSPSAGAKCWYPPQVPANWRDLIGCATATRAGAARATPLGFPGIPNDIAEGVVYLASDAARFVTGAELVIDGGVFAG